MGGFYFCIFPIETPPEPIPKLEHHEYPKLLVILRHYIFKTQRGQLISPPELDPNPNLTRTVAGLSRDVGTEMKTSGLSAWRVLYGLVRAHGVSLSRPPKPENLEFRPATTCSRSARGAAGRAGQGVGMPRPKRLEKLRIWWPGATRRAGAQREVREVPGAGGGGAAEFQKSSFSKKRTLGNLHWGSVVDPKQTFTCRNRIDRICPNDQPAQ